MPDGVRGLHPLPDLVVYVHTVEELAYGADELVDLLLLVTDVAVDFRLNLIERLRLLVAEPDVLHF